MTERSNTHPQRVLVIGLAETGIAVARVLRAEGRDVVVIEDAPSGTSRYSERVDALREVGAQLVEAPTDAHIAELVAGVDLVVPSPLVRPEHPAIVAAGALGVAVRSEIDVAAERTRMPIVAVTGTNGKTTVTTMIAAMLDASGVPTITAGNIGRPLIDAVGDGSGRDGSGRDESGHDESGVIVAEVSSFQLAFAHHAFRPRVAVLLAITPDHLDWHGSFHAYVEAKARITTLQTETDLLVYDADDERAVAIATGAPARRIGVSARADATGCFRVVGDELVFPDGRPLAPVTAMARALAHDRTNALAAAAAALDVGASVPAVVATLRAYATMPHRVALVGEARGVRWYDDSKATNPDATRRAISSFDSVVLLAGGRNKGLDLSVLATEAAHLRGVVAFGESAPEIAAAFAGSGTEVEQVAGMHEAVRAAHRMARAGDVVLLSPACASFDAYSGYAARGDDFAHEVHVQVMEEASSR
jgi:UDP-N-acetylmuramoylalanine--D-glutamate ligase